MSTDTREASFAELLTSLQQAHEREVREAANGLCHYRKLECDADGYTPVEAISSGKFLDPAVDPQREGIEEKLKDSEPTPGVSFQLERHSSSFSNPVSVLSGGSIQKKRQDSTLTGSGSLSILQYQSFMRSQRKGDGSTRHASVHPFGASPSGRENGIVPSGPSSTGMASSGSRKFRTMKSAKFQLRPAWTGFDSAATKEFLDEEVDMEVVPVSRILNRIQRPSAMFKKTMTFNSLGSQPNWVFGSQSAWRRYTEFVGFLVLLFEACWTPVQVAFQPQPVFTTVLFEYMSSVFWTLDMLIMFNSAYVNQLGQEVRDRHSIVWRYLKTWFFVDLMTVLPDWIYMVMRVTSGEGSSMSLESATGVLRALRILRLQKLSRIVSVFEQRLNSAYLLLSIQISKPILCLIYIIHVLSCMWYMVGSMEPGSWIGHYDLTGSSDILLYANAMFWSLTQFHGTSGINPHTTFELFFASFVGLLTLMGYSTFLSTVTKMMIALSRAQERQIRGARLLNEYLDRNNISIDLSVRAKTCLLSRSVEGVESDSIDTVGLPDDLAGDIKEQARCPTLLQHPLFGAICDMHGRTMRHLCCEACVERYYIVGASIFVMDDPCDFMLFQSSGRTAYTHNGDRDEVYSKEWFAEASLWVVWVHLGDLQAVSHTRTLEMSAAAFAATTELFSPFCPPAFFAAYAAMFLRALMECENVSDRLRFALDIGMETTRLASRYSHMHSQNSR